MIAAQAFLLRMITEAAREGGHIEPFTFTLRLVCGTAKAVVFRSVTHASPTCAGHSQSEVQLRVQFTYLAWDKFGNGWFQRPIPPPHIHINQKKSIWSFVAHRANTPLFILFVLFLVATIPISPSIPFSLVFSSQCQIRGSTSIIFSPVHFLNCLESAFNSLQKPLKCYAFHFVSDLYYSSTIFY